jgi:type II secretory pathway component PulF
MPSFFSGVNLKDKVIFTRNLGLLLKSGLALDQTFDILSDQTAGRFKKVIEAMGAKILSGHRLSDALAEHPGIFSNFYINTVKAGEAGGTLYENLEIVADYLAREKELKEKIRSALFYPAIVLGLAMVIALFVSFWVLPKIMPIFKGLKVDLPLTTRGLIAITGFIENSGGLALAGLAALAILFIWLFRLKKLKPFWHYLNLHLPIINRLSRNWNLTIINQTLATLLKCGLSLDEALSVTAQTATNYHYQTRINQARSRISEGNGLAESLAEQTGYFPKININLIKLGEKSGRLEEELNSLARFYRDEVDNDLKTLTTALEPILLILIGLLVGGLALSIITPIYKITGTLNR